LNLPQTDATLSDVTQSQLGSVHSSTFNILSYFAWIVPAVLLIATIVIFAVQYNKYERKKKLEQKKIQA
jgi:predicted outer membrane lipoprotein